MRLGVKYEGGHLGYPTAFDGLSEFGETGIVIFSKKHRIDIPYTQIESFKIETREYTSAGNIIAWALLGTIVLGILFAFFVGIFGAVVGLLVGALIGYSRKEKKKLLNITINDGKMTHNIVLSGGNVEKIQAELYRRLTQKG